jgi:hypothetical protein
VLAFWVLFFCHPTWGLADDQPILCASDGGKTWYFSFGTDVFEMTPVSTKILDKSHLLISNDPVSDQLVPPDPWAPLGCFSNPQQLSFFSAGGWPRFQPEGYNGDLPSGGLVELFERRGVEPPKYTGPLDLVDLSHLGHPCYKFDFISKLNDGSFYCSSPRADLNDFNLNVRTLSEFLVSKKTYTIPFNQQFEELCLLPGECQSGYQIDPYIALYYRWGFSPHGINLHLEYFIDVDRSVVDALTGVEVHNYRWPKQDIKLWPVYPQPQPKN